MRIQQIEQDQGGTKQIKKQVKSRACKSLNQQKRRILRHSRWHPNAKILKKHINSRSSLAAYQKINDSNLREVDEAKVQKSKTKFGKGSNNQIGLKKQCLPSLSKITKKNSCLTRRNPYKIYTIKKKDEFFQKLNEQYNKKIMKPEQGQIFTHKEHINAEIQQRIQEMDDPQQPQQISMNLNNTELEKQKVQKRQELNEKEKSNDEERHKVVFFQEEIEIIEYCQQDEVANFMSNEPYGEIINEQQNKLDC